MLLAALAAKSPDPVSCLFRGVIFGSAWLWAAASDLMRGENKALVQISWR